MQRSTVAKLALAALAATTLASTRLQQAVPKSELTQALSVCFGQYNQYHFGAWIKMGEIDKAAARVNQDDVEIYIDPSFLADLDAQASYVDYSMAGLQYFNDLVLADRPANIPCNTLWHEVMHSIYDDHDDDDSFLTSEDEMYTWYMEGRLALLERYLVPFETELDRGADCDPQELERRWSIAERQSASYMDFSGYGAPSQAQIDQIRDLTGFQFPNLATLRQHYEDAGLIEACGKRTIKTGSAASSRLFLLDNSGSMDFGKIDQAIASAQSAVAELSADTEVGVQFFGVAGCDVEMVLPFTQDHSSAQTTIGSAQAFGDTPLAEAIRQGAAYMRANADSNDLVMILLSDGEETCGGDPVAEAANINSTSSWMPGAMAMSLGAGKFNAQPFGRRIVLHVVGFDIYPDSGTETLLMEVAAAGGGSYFSAADQAELTEALITASEDAGGRGLAWTVGIPLALLCLGSVGVGMLLLGGVLTLRNRRRARTAG